MNEIKSNSGNSLSGSLLSLNCLVSTALLFLMRGCASKTKIKAGENYFVGDNIIILSEQAIAGQEKLNFIRKLVWEPSFDWKLHNLCKRRSTQQLECFIPSRKHFRNSTKFQKKERKWRWFGMRKPISLFCRQVR